MLYYKVLGERQQSFHGGSGVWEMDEWWQVDGPLQPCRNGIHFCRREQLINWLGPQIWLFEDGSADETIDDGDKMVTRRGRIIERLETWNETTARLLTADCAEAVLHLIPFNHREPFSNAIEVARRFARGEVSDAARDAARDTARDATSEAAKAASGAARAAAWAAAWAAARAAASEDAAWAAARAAARDAAWAAAWAAARDAAWDAAWAAAWAAARDAASEAAAWAAAWAAARAATRDAAWAAAWAAARDAQTVILFDYLEGVRS